MLTVVRKLPWIDCMAANGAEHTERPIFNAVDDRQIFANNDHAEFEADVIVQGTDIRTFDSTSGRSWGRPSGRM